MNCGVAPQTEFWLLLTLLTPISSMFFHFLLLTVLETWLPSSQTIDQPGWTPGWSDIKSVGLALSRIELKKVSQLSKHQQETFSSQCIVRNKSATRTKRRWYSWHTKHLAFWSLTFSKEFKLKMQCYEHQEVQGHLRVPNSIMMGRIKGPKCMLLSNC